MDFLTRLADRQRPDPLGVQPMLPSRFESEDTGRELVGVDTAPATEEAALPATLPPLRSSRADPRPELAVADPPPVATPVLGTTDRAAVREPGPRAATNRSDAVPPAPAPAPERVRVRDTAELRTVVTSERLLETTRVETDRVEPGAPTPVPLRDDATPARASSDPLPAPMLAPIPLAPPAVGEGRPEPERPTVTISIGRIELRPPASPTSTRPVSLEVAPPRPAAPRPRLTLEDYLARPNRGRT